MSKKEFQSWNRHTKQWIFFKNGLIHATSGSKFKGVPVRKGKPGEAAVKLPPADEENKWSLF